MKINEALINSKTIILEDGKEVKVKEFPKDFASIEKPLKHWSYVEGVLSFNEIEFKDVLQKQEAIEEIAKIKSWMRGTDYIPLKIVRGNWKQDDERYIAYCEEYKTKQARKDKLEELLNQK